MFTSLSLNKRQVRKVGEVERARERQRRESWQQAPNALEVKEMEPLAPLINTGLSIRKANDKRSI